MRVAQHGADMNIRQAILSAADSIEQNPDLYRFTTWATANPDCGIPGCALGWISYHLGMAGEIPTSGVYAALGIGSGFPALLFTHLRDAVGHGEWKTSAPECAKALRQYADIHHPEQDYIPASIRAIFTEQVTA